MSGVLGAGDVAVNTGVKPPVLVGLSFWWEYNKDVNKILSHSDGALKGGKVSQYAACWRCAEWGCCRWGSQRGPLRGEVKGKMSWAFGCSEGIGFRTEETSSTKVLR